MKKLSLGLLALALLAGIAVLESCSQASAGSGEVNVYNWAYYLPKDVLDNFTKETGIKVNYKEFYSNEEMYATIASGDNSWDVVVPSQDWVPVLIEKQMAVELDKSKLANLTSIDADVLATTGQFDPGNKFSVPYNTGASAIVYWKDKLEVKEGENSWALLADPRVKGHTSMIDDMREVMGAALKANGYSLNTTNADELAKAAATVESWKANALKPFDADSIGKNFASKDYWLVFSYPENILTELDAAQRANVGIIFPKEGGPKFLDSMMIMKAGKNTENAYKFVNYILKPETLARICDEYGYPGISAAANAVRKNQPVYSNEMLKDRDLKMNVGTAIDAWNKIWEEKIKIGQ
jgi:spermidine/putrescine transport system substrate-binding protein